LSLDALRGFDMFWIIGGDGLFIELAKYTHWGWLGKVADQLEHPVWDGFAFYDLIFPLFLFISGVTVPFSLIRRLEAGESKWHLYGRVLRRVVLLVFLGLVCNGLLKLDFAHMRYPSVLGRIGLAYGLAALIALNLRPKGQMAAIVTILLGYWAALMWIPVPGVGAGVLTEGGWLGGYIDRTVLPGKLYRGVHDPEGLFSTVPAVATALLGVLTGYWLRLTGTAGGSSEASSLSRQVRCGLGMLAAGAVCLGLGWLWNHWLPFNKNMWSSSFVLWVGGWSLLFLGVFYLVIDVLKCQRWAFPFVIIGLNPITIYVGRRIIDFPKAAHFLFDGALGRWTDLARPVWFALAVLLLEWLFLYFLYRKKTFLRV
jgi:predicted acyltransferase